MSLQPALNPSFREDKPHNFNRRDPQRVLPGGGQTASFKPSWGRVGRREKGWSVNAEKLYLSLIYFTYQCESPLQPYDMRLTLPRLHVMIVLNQTRDLAQSRDWAEPMLYVAYNRSGSWWTKFWSCTTESLPCSWSTAFGSICMQHLGNVCQAIYTGLIQIYGSYTDAASHYQSRACL